MKPDRLQPFVQLDEHKGRREREREREREKEIKRETERRKNERCLELLDARQLDI
jgi:hypothetical protein